MMNYIKKAAKWFLDLHPAYVLPLFVVALLAVFILGIYVVTTATWDWLNQIQDPVERGLAYIALAIVVSRLFGSSRKVEIEVKK